MILNLRVLIAITPLLILPATGKSNTADTVAMFLRNSNCIVKLSVERSDGHHEGYGFIVSSDGITCNIITAYHVVSGASPMDVTKQIKVMFYEYQSQFFEGTLTAVSSRSDDIAMISSSVPPGFLFHRCCVDSKIVNRGDTISAIGYKLGWNTVLKYGLLDSGITQGSEKLLVVDFISLQSGNSGTPLITSGGIAGMFVNQGEQTSRAVPLSTIERLLNSRGVSWELKPFDKECIGWCEVYIRSLVRILDEDTSLSSSLSSELLSGYKNFAQSNDDCLQRYSGLVQEACIYLKSYRDTTKSDDFFVEVSRDVAELYEKHNNYNRRFELQAKQFPAIDSIFKLNEQRYQHKGTLRKILDIGGIIGGAAATAVAVVIMITRGEPQVTPLPDPPDPPE